MSMFSVQVQSWGQPPELVHVVPPPLPTSDSEIQIRVLAAGLHNLVKSRALGKHYTSGSLPHTLGVDAVGIEVTTKKIVFFKTVGMSQGTFAELVNVPRENVVQVPGNVDPVYAAALMNPVMSSWMALKTRVDEKVIEKTKEGWDCLILGVTSMSGRLAIRVARGMGAGRVIGAARSKDKLEKLKVDLDGYIVLKDDARETDFSRAANVAVVLDYLYGPWLSTYLKKTSTSKTALTWVNIGMMAGAEAAFPIALLKGRDVTIRGSGPGAWSAKELGRELGGMIEVLGGWEDDEEIKRVKFEDAKEGWEAKGGKRIVFVNEEVEKEVRSTE